MRKRIILMILILVFSVPQSILADENSSVHTWKSLNNTSDQILQLVKQQEFEEAKQLLDYFSASFLEVDFQKEGVTMSALRTVTSSFESAVEAVTAMDMSLDRRIYKVTAFRLAVDALSSDYHPLWLHTEESIMNALSRMKETVEESEIQAFQHRFNEFLRHYEMIRPALFIDIEPQQLQRIDSQINYLESIRSGHVDEDKVLSHLTIMESEWSNLYKRVKEDNADPSLWWVMFSIGGMITLSLSYVGWKKYKAEKQKVRQKD
ncbi:sporulation protein YpjB [Halalkalibacter krulwichiae]|uniref:Sporulation protein YpjB (SpoYpjB) n=1 Tax=Halalkalibacter krulwichiae TaxID=199441 RepID=A0A1X9MCM4_9BACI|nr:sporulation protein YpjB [Halalkalibacter krulwichiae]ARK30330.1 Sporulation protein YpjB (SpoYpjB) [Halalkalibacter krulwichiae]